MGGRRSQGAGLVVAQAVGVPADVQDHGAVQEPVEQGCCHGGVTQDLALEEVIGRLVVRMVEVLV